MNITRNNVDALNAIVTVEVTKEDYAGQVEKVLADYRKNASIPGFRKGAVPMSLIQKQYGKAVLLDEVNKLLQNSLNNYLVEEKLDILGNPLPKVTEDFDWDTEDYKFEFELGLAPDFTVDLGAKNKITKFNIVVDEPMLDEQVERIQKQYGKLVSKEKVEEGDDLRGTFSNEEKGINNSVNITLDIFKDKKTIKKFIGKKAGDVIALSTKGLFDDDHKLMDYLKVSHDDVHGLDIEVNFTIEEVNTTEKAELTQELFDKLKISNRNLSFNDVLVAWLTQSISRIRRIPANERVNIGMASNGREQLGLDSNYFGNCNFYICLQFQMKDLLDKSVNDLAEEINREKKSICFR